ncbi:amino acid adenylation domain-containing protein [Methylomonas sp. MO1]|uniref:non-ribosomal peptide synthetase n=1 Tax=Methylomonas sp. MO1 TaxID=3073619 RepID=UPI0028A423A8|nr:non-ribosomal peptide synthetase [Methylomonas sp. MO1]MDT4291637.1 amino acid adenylation domain-containing protein [Methylomonas sp. MO1]
MSMEQVIARIHEKNIGVLLDGGELVIRIPQGAMDADTMNLLKQYKQSLIELLQTGNDDSIKIKSAPPSTSITPAKLPLIELSQTDIDRIVERVPGGASNIQDIYPLSPLQSGILFHHLMDAEGDTYLLRSILAFDSREGVDHFVAALQQVIERHDILRTMVVWQDLPQPVQVVCRKAVLPVHELAASSGDVLASLLTASDPSRVRLDLGKAPLLAAYVIAEPQNGEWLLALLNHHIVCDHISLEFIISEIRLLLNGCAHELPPTFPYRNFIAQLRLLELDKHDSYFREQLGNIMEPTAPFGILDIKNCGEIAEAQTGISDSLTGRLRAQIKRHGVSAAVLFHLAWARVLGQCCGQNDVVFGTVLTGRMRGGAGIERTVGMFINTLPLRISVGNVSVGKALADTQRQLTGLIEHEQASLALAQRCSGLDSGLPLFTSLLNYRHSLRDDDNIGNSWPGMRVVAGGEERTNYPMTLSVDDFGDGYALTLQCVRRLQPGRLNEYMLTSLESIVSALETHPQLPMRAITVVGGDERRQILHDWNATGVDYPQDRCIHQLFEAQVEKTPYAMALTFEGKSLSYAELNAKANQLAHYLIERGVGPDVLVGICLERSLEMVIGLLGILKAGGAYVPLDPHYPAERLAFMLADIAPSVILTQERFAELDFGGTPMLSLDSDWTRVAVYPADNPRPDLHPSNLAYCIYTSGSTGRPKGVMMHHEALVNHTLWMQQEFSFTNSDFILQKTSFSFDASVWELFTPLSFGARLVLAPIGWERDVSSLFSVVADYEITTLQMVPSLLGALINEDSELPSLPSLKRVFCGGEALPVPLGEKCRQRLEVNVINLYGPTEACIDSSSWSFKATCDGLTAPIGKPIANLRMHILDHSLNPVPIGTHGELHIGGIGLGRGYLNRPDMTAEKFIPDPFGATGGRLYKTGDLVRYRPDGNIDYLGRIDHQVKIRGFRIELGEIEAQLLKQAEIKDAVVIAREDHPGDKRLVAYVVPQAVANNESEQVMVDHLKAQLKHHLPDYMVPGAFVVLDAMPLSTNGKLDRKRLPAPDLSQQLKKVYVAPCTETERVLAEIWQEVLGVEQVGTEDDFFELGGHSLLATQLVSRIAKRFSIELPLRDLFEHGRLAALAETIEGLKGSRLNTVAVTIPPAARTAPIPLSYAQQRLWFLDQLEPDSPFYNIPVVLRLTGRLDLAALTQSFTAIVRRHEILRTVFDTGPDGEAVQTIRPDLTVELAHIDLTDLESGQDEAWQELCRQEAAKPFDLRNGPLIRARLLRLRDCAEQQDTVLLLTMHHIVSDGWSAELLVKEFSALYRAFTQGLAAPLAELPIQYADFACWQRQWLSGEVLERQLHYWRQQLDGAQLVLDLPTDRPRPAATTYCGASLAFELPLTLAQAIRALSRQHNVTLFMALLAVFQLLLSRYSGQSDLCVGSPVANRNRPEIESLIGFFVNTLVLRANVSANPTVAEFLTQIKTTVLDAQQHQDLPFEKLVEALQPERDPCRSPLFQVMFVLAKQEPLTLSLPDLAVELIEDSGKVAKFDLTLHIQDWPDGRIGGNWEYNTDLYDATSIERLERHYQQLLQAVAAQPQRKVSELPLLSEAETRQILHDWNATGVDYPQERCIHQLFEAQVEQTPGAIALTFEGESLSYAELNAKANQLAHYLIERGVGPDVLVGICVERSLAMVIGLLGILKAGGAYVPLDPNYPAERRKLILADAGVKLLLTRETPNAEFAADQVGDVVCLDRGGPAIAEYPKANPMVSLHPLHLAYLIYTSGSTGRPKGVAVNHRNAVHSTWSRLTGYPEPVKAYLLLSSFAFDSSVAGIFWTLAQGGCLYLPHDDNIKDPVALAALIEQGRISHLLALPSLYALLLEQTPQSLSGLQVAIVAGEACPTDVVKRHLAVLPGTKLYNEYGPTEGTVWSSVYQASLDDLDKPLSIGRPITNVRLYNLDRSLNPVPVGVVGELYIGGAGIVPGYWQRPDLTAERFVPDPFGPAGGRRYKTGDLVRYRTDGALEFLGRIDHQVKIRGFRIELGEIEAQLLKYADIKDAVVIAREDHPGDKRLVAYVVPHAVADTEAEQAIVEGLKARLKQQLPDYMVPSAFVVLDAMPLSANGKLDRKQLPAPDFSEQLKQAYVAPGTETEQVLAEIWQEVLGVDKVGIEDDFFELGGHSLLATQLAFSGERRLQQKFPVKMVFEHPTIVQQAAWLAGDISDADIDLLVDSRLGSNIYPLPTQPLPLDQSQAVMLTGATGFLGAFLLVELLEQTDANVYCLVRAEDEMQATARLQTQLRRYELYDLVEWSRVIAVCGDLAVEKLGLTGERYREISANTDAIFHNGALVNFVQPYCSLKPANVLGSVEVLRMAATERPKAIHYVSTLSVFSGEPRSSAGFAEADEPLLNKSLTGGYAQSKWVAEAIMRSAGSRGFFVDVYRPATVAGDRRNGVWNTDDFLCRILKGCVQMGLAPDSVAKLEMATVDDISRAIVALAKADCAENRIFHLNHPKPPTANALLDWFAARDFPLCKVPMPEWLRAIHCTAEIMDQFALKPLLGLFTDEPINPSAGVDKGYACLTTQCALRNLGAEYGEFDEILLDRYRDYFLRSKFIGARGEEISEENRGGSRLLTKYPQVQTETATFK